MSEIDVRPCRDDELVAGLTPIFHFFGRVPTEEMLREGFGRVLRPERLHAAFLDGQVIGGAGAFEFELTVPGGFVPAAGVTTVGVLPTHRRRGVLSKMMRAQIDDVHERGEPVAYLWASEGQIYGRFGYGIASLSGEIEIERVRAAYARPLEPVGSVRLVTRDDAAEVIPPVYDRVRAETPGMFSRSEDWWDSRRLADPEWQRQGGGEKVFAVHETDGAVDGYAMYRLHPAFEHFSSTGHTNVIEALGATPVATRELWRFLLDVDWMRSVKASLLPVDHPLFMLLAEPRRMLFTAGDALWVRLVEVESALAARSYNDGDAVVLEVADTYCPWNAGRFRVEVGSVARTDAEADLSLDVTALGSIYLGGFTFADLQRAGRLDELRDGAVGRADRLFYTDRAPWCPEIF